MESAPRRPVRDARVNPLWIVIARRVAGARPGVFFLTGGQEGGADRSMQASRTAYVARGWPVCDCTITHTCLA